MSTIGPGLASRGSRVESALWRNGDAPAMPAATSSRYGETVATRRAPAPAHRPAALPPGPHIVPFQDDILHTKRPQRGQRIPPEFPDADVDLVFVEARRPARAGGTTAAATATPPADGARAFRGRQAIPAWRAATPRGSRGTASAAPSTADQDGGLCGHPRLNEVRSQGARVVLAEERHYADAVDERGRSRQHVNAASVSPWRRGASNTAVAGRRLPP